MVIQPKYLLDTNMCIYLMRGVPVHVLNHFKNKLIGEVTISAITWAELQRGLNVHQSKAIFDKLEALLSILPFDSQAGVKFGELMRTKKYKANFDTLIASHALALDLILVTNNEKDFAHFEELKIQNWTKE